MEPASLAASAVEPVHVKVFAGSREDLVEGLARRRLALARLLSMEPVERGEELSLDGGIARREAVDDLIDIDGPTGRDREGHPSPPRID